MKNKTSNFIALWFIPLVAVLLAAFFTFLFVIGKHIYKGVSKNRTFAGQPVQLASKPQPSPVVPFVEPQEEMAALPPEVEEEPTYTEVETPQAVPPVSEVCPAPAVPLKLEKPRRQKPVTSYQKGFQNCLAGGIFPCAWEDNSYGLTNIRWGKGVGGNSSFMRELSVVNKQFWLMDKQGPVRRGMYDPKTGELISETIATINGTVTQFTQGKTTWYFEGGVLIKIRTSPYENCNFHDWFFINEKGEQDVCQCAYNQPDCCARSPYKEGMPRAYCDIFTRGDDFCSH